MNSAMRRTFILLMGIATLAGGVELLAPVSGHADGEVYVTEKPKGYRDWVLISVAHEEGKLNDLRAILGNDRAIKLVP